MMSLHKLTSGSGYDYLTRQVAAMDSTEKGHTSLADYYVQKGETPGRWVGSGLAGIDGLSVGDVVTADQLRSLFGTGDHPLAAQRVAALGPGATERELREAIKLGHRYGVFAGQTELRVEVARRMAAWNRDHGQVEVDPVPLEVLARIRTEVGRELFAARIGRAPLDDRELSGFIAAESRPIRNGVAGYDLTFSPVKSVSTLWALADEPVRRIIEDCHQQAVEASLDYLERTALFTRRGRAGVRQVTTRGLVATAFTHRDSRAGDPDLHTHVAIANKVQAADDGAWLAIDGRVLFKANVSASETYNTALESLLRARLRVRFENRPGSDPERPVRELVGVDLALLRHWSRRDQVITRRLADLAADFQTRHGRTPTPAEQHHLAQRATVETRQAKHEPRSLADQIRGWRREAAAVLGEDGVRRMMDRALRPGSPEVLTPDESWLSAVAGRVVAEVESRRATWQVWHLRAEAQRQVRMAEVADPAAAVERIVDLAVGRHSVRVSASGDGMDEPTALRRPDGTSVYVVAGSAWFSSHRVLAAEERLLAIAERWDGMVAGRRSIDLALLEASANGVDLNPGQVELVRAMASSGARLQVAIAPAGTGKTTAMSILATAWSEAGGMVLGLAPSATAAAALGDQIGGHADTLHLLAHGLAAGHLPAWAEQIDARTLVVVDEAGMADTLTLERVVSFIVGRGGSVRLIGDDHQLAAVEAGGILRDLAAAHGAVRLTEVVRFRDPAEAAASLALRQGCSDALGFYLDRGRVHVGDASTTLDQAFAAWASDRAQGLDALMLAPSRERVAQLNLRARAYRLAGIPPDAEVGLPDGTRVSAGDVVVTRRNDRRLGYSAGGWVRNGDRWTVVGVGRDQSLTVANPRGWQIRLPADYVAAHVQLGYASTIHGAQGTTVDTMHGVLTGRETRQQLYTMLSRGRLTNHVYVQLVGDGDPHSLIRPEAVAPPKPSEILESVLARDEAALSATSLRREEAEATRLLKPAVDRYVDALGVAAEQVLGSERVSAIREAADRLVLWLSDQPAWPVLQSQLVLTAASGRDPVDALRQAVALGGLEDARDPAAVLSWRLEPTGGPGPLPWLTRAPEMLREDATWGPYLAARADLVRDLAGRVASGAEDGPEPWREALAMPPCHELTGDLAIWRAAHGVAPNDVRPTGSADPSVAAALWQRHLEDRLARETPDLRRWTSALQAAEPRLADDPYTPVLARDLAGMAADGADVDRLLRDAVVGRPLPDDHPAAALKSRLDHPRSWPPITADGSRDTWAVIEPREAWETITLSGADHERKATPTHRPRPPGRGIGF